MCLSINFVVSDIIPLSLPIPSEIRTCCLDGDSVEGRIFRNVYVCSSYLLRRCNFFLAKPRYNFESRFELFVLMKAYTLSFLLS